MHTKTNDWKIYLFKYDFDHPVLQLLLGSFCLALWLIVGTGPVRWTGARTMNPRWLDLKFSTEQIHIPIPNRKSCKMFKNLSFLQKKWLSSAKSRIRDTCKFPLSALRRNLADNKVPFHKITSSYSYLNFCQFTKRQNSWTEMKSLLTKPSNVLIF